MPLTFPSNFRYFDDKRDAIIIPARDSDSGRRVPVRVAMGLLTESCGAADLQLASLFNAYDRHRAQLQARASRAYDQGKLDRDGAVLLAAEAAAAQTTIKLETPPAPAPRGLGRLLAALRT